MPTPLWFPVESKSPGKYNEILIMGQRFELGPTDLVVETYDQAGAYSYYAWDSPRPLFERRWRKPDKPVESISDVSDLVTCVVLHDDPGDSWAGFRSRAGKLQSMHFHIDWDGGIWQALDVVDAALHAGAADQSSIGVALARAHGFGDPANLKSRAMKVYSDPQLTALIELLRVLQRSFKRIEGEYPIDRFGRVFPKARWQKGDWHGFLGYRHVNEAASEPASTFDWEAVRMGLTRNFESFPVELTEGKNIKTLQYPSRVMALADRYAENNETETIGWYPMGINRTWHGGIRIAVTPRAPVLAMTDGVLVAACTDPKPTVLGHRGFVLLRHTLPGPPSGNGIQTEEFAFFTLFMHLAPAAVEPQWLVQLRLRNDPAVAALERGEIAAVEWRQNPVSVFSGQVVGVSGPFGPEPESMFHVEVFAENSWEKIQALMGADFFEALNINTNAMKVADHRILDVFGADLSPEGLQAFWSDRGRAQTEKRWLRKIVVRHVSEWSDQADWVRTLVAVDGWDTDPAVFERIVRNSGIARDAVRAVLPFIWFTKAMAAHIGLDVRNWKGVVEHFHPIQFLMWLQFRARRRFVNSAP